MHWTRKNLIFEKNTGDFLGGGSFFIPLYEHIMKIWKPCRKCDWIKGSCRVLTDLVSNFYDMWCSCMVCSGGGTVLLHFTVVSCCLKRMNWKNIFGVLQILLGQMLQFSTILKSCRPQHWCITSFLHFVCPKNVICCEIYDIPWFLSQENI